MINFLRLRVPELFIAMNLIQQSIVHQSFIELRIVFDIFIEYLLFYLSLIRTLYSISSVLANPLCNVVLSAILLYLEIKRERTVRGIVCLSYEDRSNILHKWGQY